MPFKPGQSGNPGGRPSDQPYTNMLRAAVNVIDPKKRRRRLELIAECAAVDAYEGEPSIRQAARVHIADRLDGKPHQTSTTEHVNRPVTEMTREELLRIAAQGSVDAGSPDTLANTKH